MLVISVLVWQLYEKNTLQREENRFFHSVNHVQNDLIDRVYRYEMFLQGGAGLFAASEEVTRNEFKAYCEYQQTVDRYPGVQGVGFAKVVQPPDLASHQEEIRAEGFPDYRVWPGGNRDLYTAIIFLEPFDERNQLAFGFDMLSEPVRRAAMEQARDSGVASVSGKVTLVQETGKDVQPGFLMYVPVYTRGFTLETSANRKAAIKGYVYAPFRMKDLIQNIFPDPNYEIDFEIYDGMEISSKTLLYDSLTSSVKHQPIFTSQTTVDLYGRQWTIIFHSRPLFESAIDRFTPKGILAAGILFSFLFFFYLRTLHKTVDQTRAMNLALQEGEAKYRFLAESIADVIWNVDLDGNLNYISPAVERLTGFTPEEILAKPLNEFIVQEDYDALFIKLEEELAKPPTERDISMTMTARHKTRDGSIVDTEFNASWLFDDQGKHYLERIQAASDRMGELINDLLTMSRVTRAEFNKQQVDLSKLATEIFATLQETEPQRKARFEIIPGLFARGDVHLLRIAMENMLGNAWKFSANNNETHIEVGRTVIEGDEVFYIRDKGAGFDMAYADKLFGAFQRLHRAEEFPGTGIGLATVQRIINRHGGKVWAESEMGKGSTFYFTLPH
jgi:PAS domain S-box-containing protein